MQALELILILLAVTAALQIVAERYSIPLPALLILAGLILAVTPGLPRVELDPDIIFLIFIPPLLYWAALTASLRDLSRNLRSISLLAVGLVLATMIVVAWVAHAIFPEMTGSSAFVLGAIVSPPDAVAVSAVTRRLGLPNAINTILNGESLLNDATAFVAYRMAVAAVVAGTFSIWQAGFRFVWTGVGAIALGLVIGWLIGRLRPLIGQTPLVENTISLLTPFVAFIPAERLGLASVLTVVATGLYLGRRGPKVVSAVTRLQTIAMWEMLVFILEGLIFIIVGLELRNVLQALTGHSLSRLIYYTVVLSAVMIAVRIGFVFVGSYLPRFIGGHRRGRSKAEPYPPWREVLFVGWAGMRGGDSLVIALALPLVTQLGGPFPARDLIIFLTFGVILISLVVQGFSLVPITRWLKLTADTAAADNEESKARLRSAQAALRYLIEISDKQPATSDGVVDKLRQHHEHRIHRLTSEKVNNESQTDARYQADYRRIRLEMISAERRQIVSLRDKSEINDDVMRRIQQDLDLEEVLLSPHES